MMTSVLSGLQSELASASAAAESAKAEAQALEPAYSAAWSRFHDCAARVYTLTNTLRALEGLPPCL